MQIPAFQPHALLNTPRMKVCFYSKESEMRTFRKTSLVAVALFALASVALPVAAPMDVAHAARPCESRDTSQTLAYNVDCKSIQKYMVLRRPDMGFPAGTSRASKKGPGGISGWLPPAPRTLTGHGHWKTLFPY